MTRTLRLESLILSLLLVSSSLASAQWIEDGTPVTTAPGHQRYPSMVADGQGGAYIAWLDISSSPGIFLQRIGPDGRPADGWPVGGVALAESCGVGAPRIALDEAGGVYVAWVLGCNPNTAFYVQRVTASGAIAPGWPTGGQPLPFVNYPYSGAIWGDQASGLFVLWPYSYMYTDGDGRTYYVTELLLQHLLPSGAVAPGWPANGRGVAWTAGYGISASVVPDGRGGLMLGYAVYDVSGHLNQGVVKREDGSGNTIYAAVLSCPGGAAYRDGIQVFPDGAGGAVVGFNEFSDYGLFLRNTLTRIDARGQSVASWAPTCQSFFPGTALSGPLIVGDGGTGVFFVWPDTRNSPDPDLYALRLDAAGIPVAGWSSAGEAACVAPGSQANELGMIPDDVGGAILAWVDSRAGAGSSAFDIFAQRIGPSGPSVAGWPVTGLPVCTAPNAQQAIQLVPDGVGGAYVCWEDYRSGSADIYVHRLGPGGPVPVQISVVGTEVEPDLVRVVWHIAEAFAGRISVQRREESGDWSPRGLVLPDGTGRIEYEDRAARTGGRYGYRLEMLDAGEISFAGEVWVDVPSPAVSLGDLSPNPSAGGWTVSLSLVAGGDATLDVIDIQGRVVMTREVGSLGAGQHQILMAGSSPLPASVYTFRLEQAGITATARGVIIR